LQPGGLDPVLDRVPVGLVDELGVEPDVLVEAWFTPVVSLTEFDPV
jgi:hypothetical protein